MKKISLLLLGLAALPASAADFVSNGIAFNIVGDNKAEVTSLESDAAYEGCIEIPASVNHDNLTFDVVAIGDNAFKGCEALNAVILPESVVTIGSGAFADCSSLKGLNLPGGVDAIGDKAFLGTPLDNISFASPEVPEMNMENLFSEEAPARIIVPTQSVEVYATALGVLADDCCKVTFLGEFQTFHQHALFMATAPLTSQNPSADLNLPQSYMTQGCFIFGNQTMLINKGGSLTVLFSREIIGGAAIFGYNINSVEEKDSLTSIYSNEEGDVAGGYKLFTSADAYTVLNVESDTTVEPIYNTNAGVESSSAYDSREYKIFTLQGTTLGNADITSLPKGIYIMQKEGKNIKIAI